LLVEFIFSICHGIVNSMVAIPQPNTDATNGSPVSPPAQLPVSPSSNAISIHSWSTDWEEEYGVMVTPLSSDATTISSSDATTISSSDATAVPSPIFPCGLYNVIEP